MADDLYMVELTRGKCNIIEYKNIYENLKSLIVIHFPNVHIIESV